MPTPKKCFVISPIGVPGSQIREHADDVFDYFIKPAMEEVGIEPIRGDHLEKPGRITEQMFKEIAAADVCVAVLTGYNPNVFYELAVAQFARKPLIILMEAGNALPFDFADWRAIQYDLKPRSVATQLFAHQIREHLRAIEKDGWKALAPPITAPSTVSAELVDTSAEYGTSGKWLKLLEDTNSCLDLMGVTLSAWSPTPGFSDYVVAKAKAGCEVRILIAHPDNPVSSPLTQPSDSRRGRGRVS
jgi:hypothetical protein